MAIEIADLEKMNEEWWEHRINELDDIEKRKEFLKELDALRAEVRWYERNFGKKGSGNSTAVFNMQQRLGYETAAWGNSTAVHSIYQAIEIARLHDMIRRILRGGRIKQEISLTPWSAYSLEDAYKYLRAKYRPEVAFLCLVKVFGEQKVAIGKLFYKPKRKDNRNKQPGHVPDDSTYIKNFDKMFDNATSLFLLRFRD